MVEQVDQDGRATVSIHFLFPQGDVAQGGGWRIACMPKMVEFHRTSHHQEYLRTDDPSAVTCASCKKSPMWRKAAGERGMRIE